jgi:hypothetical protein
MENAARRGLQRARALLDLVDLIEDTFTSFINQRPDLSDVEAARRAVQQLRPQPVLERAHVFAHRRLRQTQLPRRAGETLLRDNLREDSHAFDPVHARLRLFFTFRE